MAFGGAATISAAGWPERSIAVVVRHDTQELFSTLMGYAASAAVLGTFLMRKMVPLRLVAILSNVLFVGYGYAEHIYPVLCLHIVLLPINAQRLIASIDRSRQWPGLSFGLSRPIGPATRHAVFFTLGLLSGSAGGWIVLRVLYA